MQNTHVRRDIRVRGPALAVVVVALMAAAAITTGSCSDTKTSLCEQSGLRCSPGQVCATNQGICVPIGGCGDGFLSADKEPDGSPKEICDDGNVKDGDGCSADCKSDETCGNGHIDTSKGEECDGTSNCSPDCHLQACGNGFLDIGEICDDGNANPDDGCSANCKSNEACGNGVVDNDGSSGIVHEDCDPVNVFPAPALDAEGCDSDCTYPRCGDGHTNSVYFLPNAGLNNHEQCDTSGDSQICNKDCTFSRCGDGYTNAAAGEECDEGAQNSNLADATCRTDCHKRSCGDGIKDPDHNEECDTAGTDTQECNSKTCTFSSCGDGYTNAADGEGCDDGNHANDDDCPDGMNGTCEPARCHDGFLDKKGPDHIEECESDRDCTVPGSTCMDCACMGGA